MQTCLANAKSAIILCIYQTDRSSDLAIEWSSFIKILQTKLLAVLQLQYVHACGHVTYKSDINMHTKLNYTRTTKIIHFLIVWQATVMTKNYNTLFCRVSTTCTSAAALGKEASLPPKLLPRQQPWKRLPCLVHSSWEVFCGLWPVPLWGLQR